MAALSPAAAVPRLLVRTAAFVAWPRLAWLAFAAMLLGGVAPVRAQEAGAAPERAVKAAFLYKFLGYVEWPAAAFAQPDAPLIVGIVGADDVAAELAQITTGRTIDNRPIAVRRLHEGDSLEGVHAVFIGRAEATRLGSLLRATRERPILTVTENPGALDQGSVINFLLLDGRVRFEISVDAAEKSGLKLSSRLLAVAQSVRTGG